MFAGLSEFLGPMLGRGLSAIASPILSGATDFLEKIAPGAVNAVKGVVNMIEPDAISKVGNAVASAGFTKIGKAINKGANMAGTIKKGARTAENMINSYKKQPMIGLAQRTRDPVDEDEENYRPVKQRQMSANLSRRRRAYLRD